MTQYIVNARYTDHQNRSHYITETVDTADTITPHHLHINRNAMFFGGLNSDFYCLPVAKRENKIGRASCRERV